MSKYEPVVLPDDAGDQLGLVLAGVSSHDPKQNADAVMAWLVQLPCAPRNDPADLVIRPNNGPQLIFTDQTNGQSRVWMPASDGSYARQLLEELTDRQRAILGALLNVARSRLDATEPATPLREP